MGKADIRMNASRIQRFGSINQTAVVSVVVLNYNGVKWLERCFESIKEQTILKQIDLLFVDNNSDDSSVETACRLITEFPMGCIIQNSQNLGYCEGNNVGAGEACGKYLFFLNSDTWLEPDCLEKLLTETEKTGAAAASPWVLNYADDSHQDLGFTGFDVFGLVSQGLPMAETHRVFSACGSGYFVRKELFKQIGMFDKAFFMYSEEVDLSWRLQVAGHEIVAVPTARMHHRGAAHANPLGGAAVLEYRTTDRKRFLSNRNCLLTLLKNAQHLLLLTAIPQVSLLLLEATVGCLVLRRLSFVRATFVDVLRDCWRLRRHICEQRAFIAKFRKRSDFWMLRFFRWRLNRWFEIERVRKLGFPKST